MTDFPRYTKRDVERACENGGAQVEKWIAGSEKWVAEERAVIESGKPCAWVAGYQLMSAKDRLRAVNAQAVTIKQLAERLADADACILIPAEFKAIKQWLPVARIEHAG